MVSESEPTKQWKRMEEHEQNGVRSSDSEEHEIEEALVALVDHCKREVKNLHHYISYYTSQLEEAEKKLRDSQSKLARFRAKANASLLDVETKTIKTEHESNGSTIHKNEGSAKNHHTIPAASPKTSQSIHLPGSRSSAKASVTPGSQAKPPAFSAHSIAGSTVKYDKSQRLSTEHDDTEIKGKGAKRKAEQKEHKELVPLICKNSSAVSEVNYQTSYHIPSQHKRKLRSIALCPVNDQLLRPDAILVNSGAPVNFLEEKPHVKGVINNIVFLPWDNTRFVTGGTDHAVVLWSENGENKWKPELLHRDLHSSAVMGVAGMQQKQIVLSAGKDKRILGYNAHLGKHDFMHQVDSKCLSVLPNPCDFNLFMVQTSTLKKQLRLFDIRLKQKELHAFGWEQERSESQSALVNQAWSPNGLYITSGSADPVIHIFDIRYNGQNPSQSINAHRKRVFRAMWLQSIPVLISISSDLNIGLHKVV
ncbi:WD40/YVTN repeat-like-containing domain superfamily [Sesbania bispinosa]|nr:WD40/YVTN repeat-like-containing domain superfamily [Sesbania bispinosa]